MRSNTRLYLSYGTKITLRLHCWSENVNVFWVISQHYQNMSAYVIFLEDRPTWVEVLRIYPEFRILRLTFHRKSASKC